MTIDDEVAALRRIGQFHRRPRPAVVRPASRAERHERYRPQLHDKVECQGRVWIVINHSMTWGGESEYTAKLYSLETYATIDVHDMSLVRLLDRRER